MSDSIPVDTYRSTKHRVLTPLGRERSSVAVVVNPQWHTEVAWLPGTTPPDRHPTRPFETEQP